MADMARGVATSLKLRFVRASRAKHHRREVQAFRVSRAARLRSQAVSPEPHDQQENQEDTDDDPRGQEHANGHAERDLLHRWLPLFCVRGFFLCHLPLPFSARPCSPARATWPTRSPANHDHAHSSLDRHALSVKRARAVGPEPRGPTTQVRARLPGLRSPRQRLGPHRSAPNR